MGTLKLANLIEREKEALLAIWRKQVRELPAAKDMNDPTLNDHIPLLIEELIVELRRDCSETIPEAVANMSGFSHGLQRLRDNYDIEEVVAEYNILRGCIHDLASQNQIVLQGMPFHILNRVLDGSIGLAVQTYATEQASRVKRQREEYLSFLVHDLRTPLNSISMAGQLLERRLRTGLQGVDDLQNILKMLQGNVVTLSELVTQILEENVSVISQVGTRVEPRFFGLWGLVESVMHDLRPMTETGTSELLNLVPYEVRVYGDASLLRRVFRNLIANAIKYTPQGTIEVGAMNRGEYGAVECWVKDTGAGIPEARLENVFEKMETDPNCEDGVGLGLAIVETFIKAHDGEIRVESREGVGSTFHIFLPGKESGEEVREKNKK